VTNSGCWPSYLQLASWQLNECPQTFLWLGSYDPLETRLSDWQIVVDRCALAEDVYPAYFSWLVVKMLQGRDPSRAPWLTLPRLVGGKRNKETRFAALAQERAQDAFKAFHGQIWWPVEAKERLQYHFDFDDKQISCCKVGELPRVFSPYSSMFIQFSQHPLCGWISAQKGKQQTGRSHGPLCNEIQQCSSILVWPGMILVAQSRWEAYWFGSTELESWCLSYIHVNPRWRTPSSISLILRRCQHGRHANNPLSTCSLMNTLETVWFHVQTCIVTIVITINSMLMTIIVKISIISTYQYL